MPLLLKGGKLWCAPSGEINPGEKKAPGGFFFKKAPWLFGVSKKEKGASPYGEAPLYLWLFFAALLIKTAFFLWPPPTPSLGGGGGGPPTKGGA